MEGPDALVLVRFPRFGQHSLVLIGLAILEDDQPLVRSTDGDDRAVVVLGMRIEIGRGAAQANREHRGVTLRPRGLGRDEPRRYPDPERGRTL